MTQPPTTPPGPRTALDDEDPETVDVENDRYLTFALAGDVYALPILDVTEILAHRPLTIVPLMPAFLRGVLNLRGRVVPVVDLAVRFGRPSTEVGRRTSIIIVDPGRDARDENDHGTAGMGVMVDAVNKVVHLGPDDIEPPPAFGAGIRADFIAGMAKDDGRFIIVLDVRRVLSLDEMINLGRAALAGSGGAESQSR